MTASDLVMWAYGDNLDANEKHLAESPGGFLNFGYWKDIPSRANISIEDRIESHRALYRMTLNTLGITNDDRLLEVSCGRGHGCVLAMSEFQPAEVHGVDLVPAQIRRARAENAAALRIWRGRLEYKNGSATSLPYPDGHFDKLFSVEAIPYFSSLHKFAREAARVTHRSARVAFASTFTPTTGVTLAQLPESLRNQLSGVEPNSLSVEALQDAMESSGFKDISVVSIGEHVWDGLEAWLTTIGFGAADGASEWIRAYEGGLLDYYLINATVGGSQ